MGLGAYWQLSCDVAHKKFHKQFIPFLLRILNTSASYFCLKSCTSRANTKLNILYLSVTIAHSYNPFLSGPRAVIQSEKESRIDYSLEFAHTSCRLSGIFHTFHMWHDPEITFDNWHPVHDWQGMMKFWINLGLLVISGFPSIYETASD